MRVYLAGPSSELPRVLRWAEALEGAGIELTHRWWEAVAQRGPGRDGELVLDEQVLHARADLDAIDMAQAAWILWPEVSSHGAAVELGYLLRRRRWVPVIATGPRVHHCVFTALITSRSRHDDDGFMWLCARKHAAEDGHAG